MELKETPLDKAMRMLYDDTLVMFCPEEDRYYVESARESIFYYVNMINKTCSCPYSSSRNEDCKHIFLITLYERNGLKPMEIKRDFLNVFMHKHQQARIDREEEIKEKAIKKAIRDTKHEVKEYYETDYKNKKERWLKNIQNLKEKVDKLEVKKIAKKYDPTAHENSVYEL